MEITICKDHAAEKPLAGTEGGAGIGSRKEGTHAVGRTGGILRPRPGRVKVPWRDAATGHFVTD